MKRAVSNSDFNWLKREVLSSAERFDLDSAYRTSALVYAMITEPHRVNYNHFTLDDVCYEEFEFQQCELMKIAFKKDELCRTLLQTSPGQVFKSKEVQMNYGGFDFTLNLSCRYHIWSERLQYGAGIRSTSATSQKQFEDSVRYLDYDRQRVVYMTASDAQQDMLIGISKVNYNIFKLPIKRGSSLYKSGLEKMNEIGFKWWLYFDNFGNKI